MDDFLAGFNKVATGVLQLAKKTGIGAAAKNYISRGATRVEKTKLKRNVLNKVRGITLK